MGAQADRSRLTEDEYRESRGRNASKSRAPKHRRGDGPRYNPTLDDVTRPEPSPSGEDLLPIER